MFFFIPGFHGWQQISTSDYALSKGGTFSMKVGRDGRQWPSSRVKYSRSDHRIKSSKKHLMLTQQNWKFETISKTYKPHWKIIHWTTELIFSCSWEQLHISVHGVDQLLPPVNGYSSPGLDSSPGWLDFISLHFMFFGLLSCWKNNFKSISSST